MWYSGTNLLPDNEVLEIVNEIVAKQTETFRGAPLEITLR